MTSAGSVINWPPGSGSYSDLGIRVYRNTVKIWDASFVRWFCARLNTDTFCSHPVFNRARLVFEISCNLVLFLFGIFSHKSHFLIGHFCWAQCCESGMIFFGSDLTLKGVPGPDPACMHFFIISETVSVLRVVRQTRTFVI